jgi:hypothetical protein
MAFLEFHKCPLPQSFPYTKSSLGAQWRPLYITLLTLLVFSEMSYASLSFCTSQDKRILYIYMCVYIYFLSCCSHASLNPWPMLYLNKSKETKGWCLTQHKIHQVQNPENSHRPPLQTLRCSVRCTMELFRSALVQDIVYIFVLLFHIQVWTHDPCFIWSSPKSPKVGVWGSSVGCNTNTCKVCSGFEVTCKWTLESEKP